MSKTDTEVREGLPAEKPLWRVRVAVLVIAVAANAVTWMLASAGGVDFTVELPGQDPRDVALANVIVMTTVFGALGWAARAVLDKIAKQRAATIWLIGAAVVLLTSFFPEVAMDATAGTKIALTLMHVITAAALAPAMGRKRS